MEDAYFLGLDIGTDSVGYAVTDENYTLRKFKGEPMWGSMLFDAAQNSAERRSYRTARRRLARRQQRVKLLQELFAPEIGRIDPQFFIRRKESALYPEDSKYGVKMFDGGGITDEQYHKRYPTIHHLIVELMESDEPHDVRLVYLACAWLVAHRGHFLFDIPADQVADILDFDKVYRDFQIFLGERGYALPWSGETDPQKLLAILQMECGVRKKTEAFKTKLFGGKKLSKEATEAFPFSTDGVIQLLSGAKVKPKELCCNDGYEEVESISLTMNDEDFARIASELGDDGEFVQQLRELVNCAQLISTMHGDRYISESKVAVYEQHRKDLRYLKSFVKKYCPEKYDEIFRNAVAGNYLSYSHNLKSLKESRGSKFKFAGKDVFSEFLLKIVKGASVEEVDLPVFEDMLQRLELHTFLPKQRDGDNRVIPQQLYRVELERILNRAQAYCPFLAERDESGLSVEEKILSVFDFKIPYFVGPLKPGGRNAWIVRKPEGKILPWNFERIVNLDESETGFIRRMTNRCTYLPGEDVLPDNSLLYSKFKVLNELNNLQINGKKLPPEVKQELYIQVFQQYPRVTVKKIRDYLFQHGYIAKEDELSGLDQTIKSNLKSYHAFKRLLESGTLSESQVEEILTRMAYTEDKSRMRRWLKEHCPELSKEDTEHILHQNLKEFGRLSKKFLTGIYGTQTGSDGEAHNILEMLWNTNENLMQLLSDRYTFSDTIQELKEDYYREHPATLNQRLTEMYVANGVKRPIFRTLDVVRDVEKAMGHAPAKIFVEMARGGTPDQKGKRTQSRKDQLLALYKNIKTEDSRRLTEELNAMGEMAENRLQDRDLFLYYLQMGKSVYTGKPIDLSRLGTGTYNRDHIYPQCFVKDDSLLNNMVLVESEQNGRKSDEYPLSEDIRKTMKSFWNYLKENGLMTEEKYRRLTRPTPFQDSEKMGFINRQLVETRQSTKVITTLLQERFPEAEIVYVKAGMVSEFRKAFTPLKCRTVNDLHHAKDAYLNIVVGNVYHERFTKRWFSLDSYYNVQVEKIFAQRQINGQECYWRGGEDIELVRKTMGKNAVHLTRYAFCRKGGLFDRQPVAKQAGLIPLKQGLPTEKYGGYNKPTVSFYLLARFAQKKGYEVMFVPVNLMDAPRVKADRGYAEAYAAEMIETITGKKPKEVELLLKGRAVKIGTVISLDGTTVTLSGKSSGGRQVIFSPLSSLLLGTEMEDYIKAMESFQNKRKVNAAIQPDEQHDKLSKDKNILLYDKLTEKLQAWPYCNLPGNQAGLLVKEESRTAFAAANIVEQTECLIGLIQLLGGKASTCDLSVAGGAKKAGTVRLSSCLSNWTKSYSDVRIIDRSAAGLFESRSENLLELLK